MKYRVCALIQIATNDPRLDPDAIDISSAKATARLRQAVIDNLPKRVERVISVLPVDLAQFIMETHEAACAVVGVNAADRPPPDYIPPTRE